MVLIVNLQIYREDIKHIVQNGMVIRCLGLFQGEAIVMIDDNAHSITFSTLASNPNLEVIAAAFRALNEREFPQCILQEIHIAKSMISKIQESKRKCYVQFVSSCIFLILEFLSKILESSLRTPSMLYVLCSSEPMFILIS